MNNQQLYDFIIDLNQRLIDCRKMGLKPHTVYYASGMIPPSVNYVMNVNVKTSNMYDMSGNVIDFCFTVNNEVN